jgi:hypothetical protein
MLTSRTLNNKALTQGGRGTIKKASSSEDGDTSIVAHDGTYTLVPIKFPPRLDALLLFWNEELASPVLEVGKVAELGSEGSAFIFEVMNGAARYFVEHEMRSTCESHNKFLQSDNEIIIRNVQKALSVISMPGCEFRRHTLSIISEEVQTDSEGNDATLSNTLPKC